MIEEHWFDRAVDDQDKNQKEIQALHDDLGEGMREPPRILDLSPAVERPKTRRRTSDRETSIGNAVQSLTAAEERNGDRFSQIVAMIQESQERRDRVVMAWIESFVSGTNRDLGYSNRPGNR